MFKSLKSLKINFLLLLLASVVVLSSCENEVDQPDDQGLVSMTDEEAVLLVEASLSTQAEGLEAETAMAVELIEEMNSNSLVFSCGETQDSTLLLSRDGQIFSSSNTMTLSWTPFCTPNGLLQSLAYSRTSEGSYSSTRLSGSDSSLGEWTVDNIILGTDYIFNGTYQRTGMSSFEGRDMTRTIETEIEFELSDLALNKGNRRIDSGSATFEITGLTGQDLSFEIDGILVFLGNGAVTVIINGNQYDIQL